MPSNTARFRIPMVTLNFCGQFLAGIVPNCLFVGRKRGGQLCENPHGKAMARDMCAPRWDLYLVKCQRSPLLLRGFAWQ